ncbi:sperm-specific sodium:proton exchanger-like isoform X2 [Ornithodoros turicata]|uniref:sperm-specific sodium:proton exchanger-like isoform X2 n=1 Tax=Ornithodoros turicata TaxID=34597 RepID=UPI00313A2806
MEYDEENERLPDYEPVDNVTVTDSSSGVAVEAYECVVLSIILMIAVFLKKVQPTIHVPYTLFLFVAGVGMSYRDMSQKNRVCNGQWIRHSKFNILVMFIPAAAVYATQGVNHFIFRRCHKEIVVFAVGTLGISTVVCALYGYSYINNGSLKSSLIFAILLCSNERLLIADHLFQEGRYPILTTMLQAESILNNLFVWTTLDQMEAKGVEGIAAMFYDVVMYHVFGACGGILMGALAVWSLRVGPQSQSSNILILISFTYITFCTLEVVGSSGVDGVVAYTLVTSSHSFIACTELEQLLRTYWSVIYDITGFVSVYTSSLYAGELLFMFFKKDDVATALTAYGVRTLARLFSVVALFPIIEQFGYPVSWRQAAVTVWMGLKGPFNITMVTYLYHRQASTNVDYVSKTFLPLICDVFLNQLINITFMGFVFRLLGVLEVSEVEQRTMANAVNYLRHQVFVASQVQKNDVYFLPTDWKWVFRRTMILNPFETFRSAWGNIFAPTTPDEKGQGEHRSSSMAQKFAVANVLRIEQVSYSRQYREGMIQRNTMMSLLAALQYPFDKKVYLDGDTIESLIDISDWIKWMKETLSVSSFGEDMMDDTETLQDQLEKNLQERVIDLFEHKYYELVITSTTVTFMFCLSATLLNTRSSEGDKFEQTLVVEGVYIALFGMEIISMVTAYGHRFVRLDNYSKLDLVLVATCIFHFAIQTSIYYFGGDLAWQPTLACSFIVIMSIRLIHAIKYIQLVQAWFLDVVHRYLDKLIYSAYETSLALITGEEEVQQNVWKYVNNPEFALEARNRATNNRLFVLRNLVEIQARFPGIAVAFKSRQAGRTILNDVLKHLLEMQRDGLFGEDQYRDLHQSLRQRMMNIISAPNSMPASYKPIAVLRVIPWVGSDSIRQFLAMQLRPVSYYADEVIVQRGSESPIIIAYSGIVKIEGNVECRVDGALPNSASSLFFFSDDYFEDYLGAPVTLGALGLVTDEPTLTSVTAETPVNAYVIPRQRVVEAFEIFNKPPSFMYQLWYYIANIFGVLILQSQPKYQSWPTEKIKARLSSFLLPDLARAHDFVVSPDIEDILLVQGTLVDVNVGDFYIAPCYIPRSIKRFVFPGEYESRPRPVLIVIANKRYKLPPEYDWLRKVYGEDEEWTVCSSVQRPTKQPARDHVMRTRRSVCFETITMDMFAS